MKFLKLIILIICVLIQINEANAGNQQARIDSLVNLLKTAGREWNDYSRALTEIGEPAVPALINVAKDRGVNQWNRRIVVMTLNKINSPKWEKPALNILLDRNEDPGLRNQVTAGLMGHDLSYKKNELWKLYLEATNEFHRMNIAGLLLTADTLMAYRSFRELYNNQVGFVQQSALLNLVRLRPEESVTWYLDALRTDDWMTGNLAMDSLVASVRINPEELISIYRNPDMTEETRWRIIYISGFREEPGLMPLLLEAFREESWLVHTEAAVGLCRFDPEQVIPEMKKLVNDPIPFVRKNSVWVISRMKER